MSFSRFCITNGVPGARSWHIVCGWSLLFPSSYLIILIELEQHPKNKYTSYPHSSPPHVSNQSQPVQTSSNAFWVVFCVFHFSHLKHCNEIWTWIARSESWSWKVGLHWDWSWLDREVFLKKVLLVIVWSRVENDGCFLYASKGFMAEYLSFVWNFNARISKQTFQFASLYNHNNATLVNFTKN